MRVSPRTHKAVTVRPLTGRNTGEISGKIRLAKQNFDFSYWVKPDPQDPGRYLYAVRPVGKQGRRLTSDVSRVEFMLHPTYEKPHQKPKGPRYELSTFVNFSQKNDSVPVYVRVLLKSKPKELQLFELNIRRDQAPELVRVGTGSVYR